MSTAAKTPRARRAGSRARKTPVQLQIEALEREAALFQDKADVLKGVRPDPEEPVGPAAAAEAPVADDEDADAVSDDVAESLEWVTDEWEAPFRAFLDAQCGPGSADLFFDLYEVHNYNHAAELLINAYPGLFLELARALLAFRIKTEWMVKSGGNESPVPMVLQKSLYPLGWYETRLKGHMVVESHIASKTVKLKRDGSEDLKPNGFPRWETVSRIEPTLRQLVVDAHKIDHVKGRVAFDMEWNSKDQTFDRDLYAMRLFHESHLIGAGVLLTRSAELSPLFKRLDSLPDVGKLSTKYGASTTWMGKLLYRLRSSRSGGCPVLALGIKPQCISDWNDFAAENTI